MQQTVLRKLDIFLQKDKIGPLFYPCTKINSKWIKDLAVRPGTVKLLKENIVEDFLDFGL